MPPIPTDPNPEPEDDKGALPEVDTPPAPEDANKQVPISAMHEERTKRKAAQQERDALKAELDALKQKQKDQANPVKVEDVAAQVQKLLAEHEKQSVSRTLGLSEAQADAVMKIMQDTGNRLTAAESLRIAMARDAKLFENSDGSAFDPATHGSLKTTPGAPPPQPPADDMKERVALMKKLESVDQIQSDAIRNNIIGSMAAKAMGLPHTLIPIPKQ